MVTPLDRAPVCGAALAVHPHALLPLGIIRARRCCGDVRHVRECSGSAFGLCGFARACPTDDESACGAPDRRAVVDEPHPVGRKPLAQECLRGIVMSEVHGDNLGGVHARAHGCEVVEHDRKRGKVEVARAMVEVISEGFLQQDDVVRRARACSEITDRARVRGVEQAAAIGSGEVVEHGLIGHGVRCVSTVCGGHSAHGVVPARSRQSPGVTGSNFVELDGSARSDPISAAAQDGRRTPQVQHGGSGIPIEPQQQRRVEMIRMRMRDEDVAHISQRHSCPGSG